MGAEINEKEGISSGKKGKSIGKDYLSHFDIYSSRAMPLWCQNGYSIVTQG